MARSVAIGETFTVRGTDAGRVDTFRREDDDPAPRFESERIRVTHLACNVAVEWKPYTFGTEPEWFHRRGLTAA